MPNVKDNPLYRGLNWLYYVYRRNNWMLDLSRFYKDFGDIKIDRPIFLLGTQGGGLTLISRMLRRNERVVSVTGDHHYWTGADEMQNVLGPILPPELTGIKHKAPPDEVFSTPRGWLYATDRLIEKYRNDETDVDSELKERVKKILRWIIARHSSVKKKRFTDKSQVYTVKVSFLNELLKGSDPKFVLITRNPYAVCYRSAKGKARSLKLLEDEFNLRERVEFAAQHWANSMRYALKDREEVDSFLVVKFEDILNEPRKHLQQICSFADLSFSEDMIPQPEHEIPFGSRFYDRWYPLRPEVNEKYFEEMEQQHLNIISSRCEKYAEEFGYPRPELG